MEAHAEALQAHIAARAKARNEPVRERPAPRTSTTPAAAPEAAPRHADVAAAEKRIAELNDPTQDVNIFSKDPTKQRQAVAELRRMMAAAASDEGREAVANASVEQLRERLGVESKLPAHLREAWDSDTEGTVLGTLANQGVAPEAARAIHSWYEQTFIRANGDAQNIDATQVEGEFRELANKHGLPQDLTDGMVTFEKHRLGLSS